MVTKARGRAAEITKQRSLLEVPAELKFRFLRSSAAAVVAEIKGPKELRSRFLRSEHWPTGIEVFKEQQKTGWKSIEKLLNGSSGCYRNRLPPPG